MRGIILAGGSGTRLHPLTTSLSKQLLPVYDKPMIYYPLSVLMLAGITEILVITNPEHLPAYQDLLDDGAALGLDIRYASQDRPRGLADALIIGADFVGDDQVCLILGDNIFYGQGLGELLRRERSRVKGATLFGYPTSNPERYGVAMVDANRRLVAIEEKPRRPRSNLAVTGLYMYDNDAIARAAKLTPSDRGELEITDLNQQYIQEGNARLVDLGRGMAWFDAGTHDSLLDAGTFVQVIQKRQGIRLGCLEEVAYRMGFINAEQLAMLGKRISDSSEYGRYVAELSAAVARNGDIDLR